MRRTEGGRYLRRTLVFVRLLLLVNMAVPLAAQSKPSPLEAIRLQIDHGKLNSAEDSLWKMLAADSNNGEALNLLGVIRGKQGRFAEAESLFRRVVVLNSQSASGYSNLGEALIAEDKNAEAIQALKQAEILAPKKQETKLALAHLYIQQKDYQEALLELRGLSAQSTSPETAILTVNCLLGLGRTQEALGIARAQTSPADRLAMAQMLVEHSLPDAVFGLVPTTTAQWSKHELAEAAYIRGEALQLKNDFQGAKESFERAVALDATSAESLTALASLYARNSEHQKSAELLQRVDQLVPDSLPVLRELVFQLLKANENESAARYAGRLAKLSPDNADDLFLVGTAMLQFKDYPAAEGVLLKYLKQRPEDGRAVLALGAVYREQQRYNEAEATLSRAKELFPEQAEGEVEYQLGLLAQRRGDDEKALQCFQHVVASHPEHAQALGALGSEYLKLGNLTDAATALQHSVSMDDKNPETHYQLSLLYKRTGQLDLAREQMDIFRKLRAQDEGSAGSPPKLQAH